jgi:integrase
MPKKKLTDQGVAKLKPPAKGKQVDYFDAYMPGLVLRLNYGGRKTWRALYYVPTVAKKGKRAGQRISMPTTRELGRYPNMTLKEARAAAKSFDPKKALAQTDAGSFKKVAETFIKRYVDEGRRKTGDQGPLRSKKQIERLLDTLVLPKWGNRPFHDIRRGDVNKLLDDIVDNNGARTADIVLAIVRRMMNWFATTEDDYESPVVPDMQRGSNNKRDRWLTDDEIRALWTACGDMGTFGALVKTLLLTGQRIDKVAKMQWDHVVDGVWTIPRQPREKTNAGKLKLAPMARAIIAGQPRIDPYVFAKVGSIGRRKQALDKKLKELGWSKLPRPPRPNGTVMEEQWRPHDLRRTCRELMTRAGVRQDVGELALGHSIKGIQATYDNRAAYQPMIDDALARVAAEIGRILSPTPDNVVPLREAKS